MVIFATLKASNIVLSANKLKVFNDPIYGSVGIPSPLLLELISHPYFQRLRRISQMGLSYLVYPGAHHTRFQHALGAMHLMQKAIETLSYKGIEFSEDQKQGLSIAILLHDIGHGPFSHALERKIVDAHHEQLSLEFMNALNSTFNGELDLAIAIFKGKSELPYLNQLVSSQLDMDRLDYLKRDSFYAGVTEGNVNSERLISTLSVFDGDLVIEEKGIYSVEKFLMARRFMYWQVYLHKTSIVAELMLGKIIERARELIQSGASLAGSTSLVQFLSESNNSDTAIDINAFAEIDDIDVLSAIKQWKNGTDRVLSLLCEGLLNRDLLEVRFQEQSIHPDEICKLHTAVTKELSIDANQAHYFVYHGTLWNLAYNRDKQPIKILFRDGSVVDFIEASKYLGASAFSARHEKNYVCSPRLKKL